MTAAQFDGYKRRVAAILNSQASSSSNNGGEGRGGAPSPPQSSAVPQGAGSSSFAYSSTSTSTSSSGGGGGGGDDFATYKARTARMLREANVMTARYKAEAQRNAEDFNAPDAYQAATNAALLAQRRALSMLATAQA